MSHSTNGTNGVHLVDIFGNDVPVFEKDIPEVDGPASWPVCVELDAIHYEVSDPAERAALEAAAISAECDRRDAVDPQPFHWLTLVVSDLPPIAGGAPEYTAEDRRSFEEWLDQVDRDYPPVNQVSDDELAQLAAHGCI